MKTTLHLIAAVAAGLLISEKANAQIDYFQDFSTTMHEWTTSDFVVTDVAVCDNPFAFRAAYKNDISGAKSAITYSPNLGLSNGEQIILSYNYKVLLYDSVLPYQPAQGNNWGNITVEYGPTVNGPWNIADYIDANNHIPANACTLRQLAFTPPDGSAVFLRVTAGAGTDFANAYYVYLDGISVLQDNLTVRPAVAESPLKVYPNPVSDYLVVEYAGAVNSMHLFNNQGEPVSIENIGGDFFRLDFSGLERGNYTLKVVADNDEVTTINVEKKELN